MLLRRLKNDSIYLGVRIALSLARILPLAWLLALGRLLGELAWLLAAGERRRALMNLQSVWPNATEVQRAQLGRRSFANLGITAAEVTHLPEILRRARFDVLGDSQEKFSAAIKQGRGVIFVTAHLGNWELLGAYLAKIGTPATVVTRALYDARLDRLLQRVRQRVGLRTIERDAHHRRAMLGALRRGDAVGLLMDQHVALPGAYLPFLGRPAWTLTAPFAYAARRQIPVVCGFLRRRALLHYEIEILPLAPDAAAANSLLEQAIKQTPDQWVWNHRRWGPQSE